MCFSELWQTFLHSDLLLLSQLLLVHFCRSLIWELDWFFFFVLSLIFILNPTLWPSFLFLPLVSAPHKPNTGQDGNCEANVCGGAVASGFSGHWLKPRIDETVEGKIIVEEFLHFLGVKLKTMNLDEIILVASNTFDSMWIEPSRKVLHELCPKMKQRYVAFKSIQKDINNFKRCLKVWNEFGENISCLRQMKW